MAIFAVDAGGTRIKLALVHGGKVLAKSTLEAYSSAGLKPRLPFIAEGLRKLVPADVTPTGLGIAFPSLVKQNRVTGDVGKYQDAELIDLAAWSMTELGVPLAMDNDARLATVGEWKYGAGQGTQDFVMVTLGTGIGTGAVVGGQVLRGSHGAAGILGGHMTARLRGRACPCGNAGCWETEASTAALPAMAADDHEFSASSLAGRDLSYETVFSAASDGDAVAARLRDRSLEVWGALAVSLIHAYDPEVIAFGGGVMASGELILESVRQAVVSHAWPQPRVVKSLLGDEAALLGCEALFELECGN